MDNKKITIKELYEKINILYHEKTDYLDKMKELNLLEENDFTSGLAQGYGHVLLMIKKGEANNG